MDWLVLAAKLLGYILAGRLVIRCLGGTTREIAFAAVNLGGLYLFFFSGHDYRNGERFCLYVALIIVQYVLLRLFANRQGSLPWIAFFTPIAALIAIRYVPGSVYAEVGRLAGTNWKGIPEVIGISYLAFRTSRLVLEVRNGAVPMPSPWQYLSFSFFVPTMPVGPINTYANYRRGFEGAPLDFPLGTCVMRVLVGFIKFEFLGSLCNQLTYSGLLLDDHPHHWIDLPVAILFFYLYLYLNFSGFCDMAIGAAGLIGIPVPENFDNPFAARNVKDFWNRWHITLSVYMRDVVFGPLSKFLAHRMGHQNVDHAIALTITIVFLLVGIWHGAGWNFAAYGAVHAIGVVSNHYYTIFLKKRLGRDGFKAYNANPWIHAVAVACCFCYCATSLILFANTFPEIRVIFLSLQ